MYDDEPFIQSARIEDVMQRRWPKVQHFSPCPSLGDPDGVEVLGDAQFALWNPEGRHLRFRIGTYLPRKGGKGAETAQVKIVGAEGKTIFAKELPMLHVHEADGQPTDTLETGRGVSLVSVTGPEALALVYLSGHAPGAARQGCWRRLASLSLHRRHPRNWYFFVPPGTREFAVRAAADDEDDVMHFEVCSPDRTAVLIYDRAGERTVKVPAVLAGKIWHLRPDCGQCDAHRRQGRPGLPLPGNSAHRRPQGCPRLFVAHVGTVVRSFSADGK